MLVKLLSLFFNLIFLNEIKKNYIMPGMNFNTFHRTIRSINFGTMVVSFNYYRLLLHYYLECAKYIFHWSTNTITLLMCSKVISYLMTSMFSWHHMRNPLWLWAALLSTSECRHITLRHARMW